MQSSPRFLWLLGAARLLYLPASVVGNPQNALEPWERDLYLNDRRILFMSVDSLNEDYVAIYARTGQAMTVPGNHLGFKAPLEYWTGTQEVAQTPMKSGNDIRLHGFDRQNMINNESWFWFTAPEMNNVVFRIRQLEERWVAWTLVEGEPIAAYFGWTKVKMRFGLPIGYEYISMHGHKITNCKIDYESPTHGTLTPGTHPWELKRGMLIDPLCACGPNPTCALVENNVECFSFVNGLLMNRMVRSRAYKKYIDALAASKLEFMYNLSQDFTIEGLTNASCDSLPAMLPDNLTEPLGACTDILLYDLFQREAAYLTELGQWKGQATNEWQMREVLESPRVRWLLCMQQQTQDRLTEQNVKHSAVKFKGLHHEIDNLWSELSKKKDKPKDDAADSSLLIAGNLFLTALICLWLCMRDCVCGCCRWLCCTRRSEKRRARQVAETLSSRGGQELAAPLEIAGF